MPNGSKRGGARRQRSFWQRCCMGHHALQGKNPATFCHGSRPRQQVICCKNVHCMAQPRAARCCNVPQTVICVPQCNACRLSSVPFPELGLKWPPVEPIDRAFIKARAQLSLHAFGPQFANPDQTSHESHTVIVGRRTMIAALDWQSVPSCHVSARDNALQTHQFCCKFEIYHLPF